MAGYTYVHFPLPAKSVREISFPRLDGRVKAGAGAPVIGNTSAAKAGRVNTLPPIAAPVPNAVFTAARREATIDMVTG